MDILSKTCLSNFEFVYFTRFDFVFSLIGLLLFSFVFFYFLINSIKEFHFYRKNNWDWKKDTDLIILNDENNKESKASNKEKIYMFPLVIILPLYASINIALESYNGLCEVS